MLLYNVYNMSTTTTPTRNGRGMPVPGINTTISDHVSPITPPDTGNLGNNKSMVFQHHLAPLTPPQSATANESRRPSLAYSSLSDAHSGPSSVCGYSQPATPISPMHGQDFRHQWSEGADVQAIQSGMQDVCSHGQMPPPMFSASFPHQPTQAYSAADAFGMSNSAQSPWFTSQQSHSQHQNSYQPGLMKTLFQTSQSLGHDSIATASMYANSSPTIPSLEASPFASAYDVSTQTAGLFHQPAQVVVPSQVTPHEDYPMNDFNDYPTHQVSDGFANSFGSGASSCSGLELIGPNSPADVYCGQFDEDDYVNVKDEALPTHGVGSHDYHHLSPHQARPRRRASRRTRKTHPEGKAWYETDFHGISMRCEGKSFGVTPKAPTEQDPKPYRIDFEKNSNGKQFKCTYEDHGVQCGRAFERSEHLKRHQGMHSDDRPYVCPLEDCQRKIGRPDNAGDHFKTHLRGHTKGKRNKGCTFSELEKGIIRIYDEKTAGKLLSNLRKWMGAETERKRMAELQKLERERTVAMQQMEKKRMHRSLL